jgi:uncharacterized protein
MGLVLESSDAPLPLRGLRDGRVWIGEADYGTSVALTPDGLLEDWAPGTLAELRPEHLDPLLAQRPDVILLGTGPRQVFPPPALLAHCLAQGVGLEPMDNAAAARTWHVLAGEGRRVTVAFLLPG